MQKRAAVVAEALDRELQTQQKAQVVYAQWLAAKQQTRRQQSTRSGWRASSRPGGSRWLSCAAHCKPAPCPPYSPWRSS
ncbi:hypothetical protein HaLaN_05281 [Haematococcus lacustris]|uniref:Uncharacterized protein n=1 Tax=Haematococcus lacustris TaxID=44745 RepID=A0A699YQI8_HAELA|nr:hypothetical protein HaLaN_05281 [Haematococcus lacustris]